MRTYRAESNYQFTGADTEFITAALLNLATLQTLYPEGLLESSEIGALQLVSSLAAAGPWFTATDGGSANTIVLLPANSQTLDTADLVDLLVLAFRVAATNTGATTVRFSAGDATPRALVKPGGAALGPGDLRAGMVCVMRRNSTNNNWELLSPVANVPVSYAADSSVVANTITLAPAVAWTAYEAGRRILAKVAVSVTGSATANVSGLGARTIKKVSTTGLVNVGPGDVIASGIYEFVDDGTYFVVLNPSSNRFTYTSGVLSTTGGATVVNESHGLGVVPSRVRAVLYCATGETVASIVFAAGDEVEIAHFVDPGGDQMNAFVVIANSTSIKVVQQANALSISAVDGATPVNITPGNWKVKVLVEA